MKQKLREKLKKVNVQKLAKDVGFFGALLLVLFSARWSLADHYVVPTGSMLPTVQHEDRVLVNKMAYDLRVPFTDMVVTRFEGPQRGDVVVLDSPVDGKLLLKRVVAIPGDQVTVRQGQLSINGEEIPITPSQSGLEEHLGEAPHPVQLTYRGGPDFGPLKVLTDHYLVMGDNRGNSLDGRSFGLVPRRLIRGEVLGVYFREGPTWESL